MKRRTSTPAKKPKAPAKKPKVVAAPPGVTAPTPNGVPPQQEFDAGITLGDLKNLRLCVGLAGKGMPPGEVYGAQGAELVLLTRKLDCHIAAAEKEEATPQG